jgi:Flp pilus assembly protein TadG
VHALLPRITRCLRRERTLGQSLVEFALVLPLFLTVMLAIIEFAFTFNAVLAVNFASRTAALLAAEGGADVGTDCVVLRSIESNIQLPANNAMIMSVEVYRANTNGEMLGTATVYDHTGTTDCELPGGITFRLPYQRTQDGYPETTRCAALAGCGGTHPTLEIVGVRITYHHSWVTPLRSFVGGYPGGLMFARSNATRMEPVL